MVIVVALWRICSNIVMQYVLSNICFKFAFGLWTLSLSSALIERQFGKNLSLSSFSRLMKMLALSAQKPLYPAWQQDATLVQRLQLRRLPDPCGDSGIHRRPGRHVWRPVPGEVDDAISLRNADCLTRLLIEHPIGATMLAPKTPAVELLDHLSGWRRLYADEIPVVHVRTS